MGKRQGRWRPREAGISNTLWPGRRKENKSEKQICERKCGRKPGLLPKQPEPVSALLVAWDQLASPTPQMGPEGDMPCAGLLDVRQEAGKVAGVQLHHEDLPWRSQEEPGHSRSNQKKASSEGHRQSISFFHLIHFSRLLQPKLKYCLGSPCQNTLPIGTFVALGALPRA